METITVITVYPEANLFTIIHPTQLLMHLNLALISGNNSSHVDLSAEPHSSDMKIIPCAAFTANLSGHDGAIVGALHVTSEQSSKVWVDFVINCGFRGFGQRKNMYVIKNIYSCKSLMILKVMFRQKYRSFKAFKKGSMALINQAPATCMLNITSLKGQFVLSKPFLVKDNRLQCDSSGRNDANASGCNT